MVEKNDVPYIVFESTTTRLERIIEKLWVVIIVLISLFVISNGAWIYYESQWEYTQESTQIEADQEGQLNIIGGGDVSYGAEGKD